MNCGSSSDENSINEYRSNKKGRTYGRLCPEEKQLVCWKCLLKFAQHLPSVPVIVCCKFKNELWKQF